MVPAARDVRPQIRRHVFRFGLVVLALALAVLAACAQLTGSGPDPLVIIDTGQLRGAPGGGGGAGWHRMLR